MPAGPMPIIGPLVLVKAPFSAADSTVTVCQ